MQDYPLLKYAVNIIESHDLVLEYRDKIYVFNVNNPSEYKKLLSLCNGKQHLKEIISQVSIKESDIDVFLGQLAEIPMILDGKIVLRKDGLLSGREMFWRLEGCFFKWKKHPRLHLFGIDFEKEIALGIAPEIIIKGFCLETSHLLRNVPDELSLAISTARNPAIRAHFMKFYDEESKHGEIIFKALKEWIDVNHIMHSIPLPATIGLLNTYRYWASKDSLLYAVALIRDETSSLDAEVDKDEDIYHGMKAHYNIPEKVIRTYEWHANIDRKSDHAFFPEKIFAEYETIDFSYAYQLFSALQQIIELHELFKWNTYSYYKSHSVESRLSSLRIRT